MSSRNLYNEDFKFNNLTVNDLTINGTLIYDGETGNTTGTTEDISCMTLEVSTSSSLSNATATQLNITDNLTVGGDVNITGLTTLQNSNIETLNVDTLNVSGVVTLSDGLNVNDTVNCVNIVSSGGVQFADTQIIGNCNVQGLLTTQSIQSTTITATSNLSCQSLTVNGNPFIGSSVSCEYQGILITGNSSTAGGFITLEENSGGSDNYSVFTSWYYGLNPVGGGNYSPNGCSDALQGAVIIYNRTAEGFYYTLSKSNGDIINIYLNFLIVYEPFNTTPATYSAQS